MSSPKTPSSTGTAMSLQSGDTPRPGSRFHVGRPDLKRSTKPMVQDGYFSLLARERGGFDPET